MVKQAEKEVVLCGLVKLGHVVSLPSVRRDFRQDRAEIQSTSHDLASSQREPVIVRLLRLGRPANDEQQQYRSR